MAWDEEEMVSVKFTSDHHLFHTLTIDGLVRDHIYSRYQGFIDGLDPLIVAHPVNCQYITKEENVSKGNNAIWTKELLFVMIQEFEGKYEHHEETLKRMEQYDIG